jgi:hypothetical protein
MRSTLRTWVDRFGRQWVQVNLSGLIALGVFRKRRSRVAFLEA